MDTESTEYVANEEPWRTGQGQTKSALDPGWNPGRKACPGDLAFEAGTKWWWCKACGYTGWGTYTKHEAPKHPKDMLQRSKKFFFDRRRAQGVSREVAEAQAMHLQAVVLRVAAALPPSELRRYIDENVIPPNLV